MKYLRSFRSWWVLCLCATIVVTSLYLGSKWITPGALIEPDDDGRAIVTKYLKALGGDGGPLILKAGYIKYIAKAGIAPIKDDESIVEDTFDFPRHFKRVVRVKTPTQDFKMIFVSSDGRGWAKVGDKDPGRVKTFKTGWMGEKEHDLATLWNWAPALEENVRLTRDNKEKVGKHTAVIVHVSGEDGVETDLYFDEKSALLIKSKKLVPAEAVAKIWATMPGQPRESREAAPGEVPDKLIAMEVFLEDYQKVQGRAVPMKIRTYQNGKPLLDVTLKEVKFLEKIDEAEFAGP